MSTTTTYFLNTENYSKPFKKFEHGQKNCFFAETIYPTTIKKVFK